MFIDDTVLIVFIDNIVFVCNSFAKGLSLKCVLDIMISCISLIWSGPLDLVIGP